MEKNNDAKIAEKRRTEQRFGTERLLVPLLLFVPPLAGALFILSGLEMRNVSNFSIGALLLISSTLLNLLTVCRQNASDTPTNK